MLGPYYGRRRAELLFRLASASALKALARSRVFAPAMAIDADGWQGPEVDAFGIPDRASLETARVTPAVNSNQRYGPPGGHIPLRSESNGPAFPRG